MTLKQIFRLDFALKFILFDNFTIYKLNFWVNVIRVMSWEARYKWTTAYTIYKNYKLLELLMLYILF